MQNSIQKIQFVLHKIEIIQIPVECCYKVGIDGYRFLVLTKEITDN